MVVSLEAHVNPEYMEDVSMPRRTFARLQCDSTKSEVGLVGCLPITID